MKIYDYNGKKNIVGERIKIARLKKHLSQEQLSAQMQVENVNIEQKSLSRIEKGERFVADYELLFFSQILNVDVNWLLTGDNTWET